MLAHKRNRHRFELLKSSKFEKFEYFNRKTKNVTPKSEESLEYETFLFQNLKY